ncbi:MAG: protein YceG like protein, partial [Alphaproteobacteria bacterium]|nr:protein YceG like protein [Alphaproteobacteria bacterium]
YPQIFYALLRWQPFSIKAGEYGIPAHASMQQIIDILHSGRIIQRNVTLAEGLTVKQTLILIANNIYLTGDVTQVPAEGTLLPDTYNFLRGATRDSIVKRMQEAQQKFMTGLWEKRDLALPLKTPEEAVTLASIVEKETGVGTERARIAGLFYNRLKIGMPLQSDPTVVYVITDGLGHMGGKRLYSKNLEVESPYNTYRNNGLPPGPIANPGRAALEAVFHPEAHEYLYFVANGTGGHVFARTLDEHNANVAKWREIRKEMEK